MVKIIFNMGFILLITVSGWAAPAQKLPVDTLQINARQDVQTDTMWQWLEALPDSQVVVSPADSVLAYKKLVEGVKAVRTAGQWLREKREAENKGRTPKVTTAQVITLLEKGRTELEGSLRLNPLDTRTKEWLAAAYRNLAVLYTSEKKYEKAIERLQPLIRIKKDEHGLYFRLGESYFGLENWQKARQNFDKAVDVALDTNWAEVDTTQLFRYIYYRANTEIKLGLAEAALRSFDHAQRIAPNARYQRDIQNIIDWINWDDGNIPASETRDALRELERTQKYSDAKTGYLELLENLTTDKAKDEINWRIAVLDFHFLNNKQDGITRLLKLVKRTPQDSSGAPLDSTYYRYFDNFGAMCYSMGIDHLNKKESKIAYIYFTQASAIDWSGRGKSYLQLARLSIIDAPKTVENCKKALALEDRLTENEKRQAFGYLYTAYKQMGDFDEAEKWYKRYQQF